MMLKHKEWITTQFKKTPKEAAFKNVILHAGFIESIIRFKADKIKKGKGKNFRDAFKFIRKDIPTKERQWIIDLWKKRNELIHGILKNKWDERQIIIKIRDARNLIEKIYKHFSVVRDYFKVEYDGFDTKDHVAWQ